MSNKNGCEIRSQESALNGMQGHGTQHQVKNQVMLINTNFEAGHGNQFK